MLTAERKCARFMDLFDAAKTPEVTFVYVSKRAHDLETCLRFSE